MSDLLHAAAFNVLVRQISTRPPSIFTGMVGVQPLSSPCASAGGQRDVPVVQRTGDAVAVDNALAQWPALVRAAIDQCEDLVVAGAEDRDFFAALDRYRPRCRAPGSRQASQCRATRRSCHFLHV